MVSIYIYRSEHIVITRNCFMFVLFYTLKYIYEIVIEEKMSSILFPSLDVPLKGTLM